MKKIHLILAFLISFASFAQAEFPEGIQLTNQTSTTATKVNVQEADGVINTIAKSDLVNVVEVNDVPSLPLIGEVGKIYVVKDINKLYRWNGTFYSELAVTDISGKEDSYNKVSIITASTTQYPNNNAVIAYNNENIGTATQNALDGRALFNGANASGTWGINISGNANNASNWGGKPADFSDNVTNIANIAAFDSALGYYRTSTKNQVNTFLSPYNQQVWGLIGDSFAELNIYQPDLQAKLGIFTISDGIGGTCITGGTNFAQGDAIDRVPFVDRIDSMLSNTISGIIIEGGSNDFYYQAPLGDINSTDRNTFYGALKEILAKCVNRVSATNVRLVTPTVRDNTKAGGTLGRAYYENQLRYVNAMKEVGYMYSVIVIDEFGGSGLTYENLDILTTDGTHPSEQGKVFYNNFLIANFDVTSGNPNLYAVKNYKVYTALLSQSGTNAPTATVLENTLGFTPIPTYVSVGSFNFSSGGNYTVGKTVCIVGDGGNILDEKIITYNPNASQLFVVTTNAAATTTKNGVLNNTMIEIRVYN